MSVPNTNSRIQYTLASATQTVAVPFFFLEEEHLKVIRLRAGVYTTLTLATHYTTTGENGEAGGAVIFNGAGTAIADVITIIRSIPINQLVDLVYNGRFPGETIERALDRLTMVCQALSEILGRTIRFEAGEVLDGETELAARLGKLLSFNATTGVIEYVDAAGLIAEATEQAAIATAQAAIATTQAGISNTKAIEAAASAALAASYQAKIEVVSIAALKALSVASIENNDAAIVLGYYSAGDGGGGLFYFDSASSTTDNGGTVIQPTVGTGRWRRVVDGVIDVRYFGAKGDGVTDDTAKIAGAFNSSGTVFLSPGIYIVDGLEMPSGKTLLGAGKGQSILKLKANASTAVLFVNSTSQRCVIQGIEIDGNKANQSSALDGIEFLSVGAWPSGTAYPGGNHRFSDIYVHDTKGDAFDFGAGGGVNTFTALYAFRVDGRGMHVNLQDSMFNDIDLGDCGLHGLELNTGAYNCRFSALKCWFSGQIDSTTSGDGIYCRGYYNVFTGVEIQDARRNGITLKLALYNNLIGFNIESPGTAGAGSTACGLVIDDSRHNIVKGVILDRDATKSMKYAVKFVNGVSGADYNDIEVVALDFITSALNFDNEAFQTKRNRITINGTNDDGWVSSSNRVQRYQDKYLSGGSLLIDTGSSVDSGKYKIETNGNDSVSSGFSNARMLHFSGSHGSAPGMIKASVGGNVSNGNGFVVEHYDGTSFMTLFRATRPSNTYAKVEAVNAAWNTGGLYLGGYALWVDGSGRLRIKSGAPSSDTDGTIVGLQS
jgi:hypothetical protein